MRAKLLLLLGLCGVLAQACGDDEKPPGPPVSVGNGNDGGGGTGGPYIPVGGSGGSDEDSGLNDEDGGGGTGGASGNSGMDMGSRCRDVDAVPPGTDPDPEMLANVVTLPTDLVVTRAEAAWEEGCIQPSLRVTVSSGNCPDGDGHQLTFFLPADGVEESTLFIGQNLIMPEPAAGSIRVRYTRPTRIDPSGVWGTCAGSDGTLDIIGDLELIQGRILQASYILDLTRCDDGEESVQEVTGSFHVEVPASLSAVCP
jgi:hypothetical protein